MSSTVLTLCMVELKFGIGENGDSCVYDDGVDEALLLLTVAQVFLQRKSELRGGRKFTI